MVKFCKSGFRPLPFVTMKSASVGENGFSMKLTRSKKNDWINTITIITQGINIE